MNRLYWYPDRKGVEMPRRTEPKEKREPGGMPILPGEYKLIMEYDIHKDSTQLTVKSDPRLDQEAFDTKSKYAAMSDFNKSIEGSTKAYNNLKEAKKSMSLYSKLIEVQADSTKKKMKKRHKEIAAEIDSLKNLYLLDETDKPEYRDSEHTLMNQIWTASR